MVYFSFLHVGVFHFQLFATLADEVNFTVVVFRDAVNFAEFLAAMFAGVAQHADFFVAAGTFWNLFNNLFLLLIFFTFLYFFYLAITLRFNYCRYFNFLDFLNFSFLAK